MAQITEDFVSFETAKLLREKGFDAKCDYLYADGELIRARGGACNWNSGETLFADYKNECSAPTLQMAMKYLREVHNLHINLDILWLYFANALGWIYIITKILENGVDKTHCLDYNGWNIPHVKYWMPMPKLKEEGL